MRSFTRGRKRAQNTSRSVFAFALCASLASSHVSVSAEPVNPSQRQIADANSAVGSSESRIAELIAALSESDSRVASLELEMGGLREAVNKALVDLKDAQARAEQARQGVSSARKDLDKTQTEIDKAQVKLDEISRAAYRNGASAPGVSGVSGNGNSEDALARQTYLRTSAQKQRDAIEKLDRLRTEQANEESKLRQARDHAEAQEAEALEAQQSAQHAIDENAAALSAQQQEHESLIAQRDEAQSELDAARGLVDSLSSQREEFNNARAERDAKEQEAEQASAAAKKARETQEKLQKEAEAAAERAQEATRSNTRATDSGDQQAATREAERQAQAQREADAAAKAAEEAKRKAEQEAENERQAKEAREAALAASSAAAAALVAVAQPEHATIEDPYLNLLSSTAEAIAEVGSSNGGEAGAAQPIAAVQNPETPAQSPGDLELVNLETNETVTEEATQAVSDASANQKVETAISRAMSQLGVPYVWGGGDANGPTRGLNDGGAAAAHGDHNKVGFDCSGLVLYAYAGAGISLSHYTGHQYNAGQHVSPSEMKRGDLIFYGHNGSQHVAIYLGDGQMIEAPQSGSVVSVVPVRWSNMSQYAVRLV